MDSSKTSSCFDSFRETEFAAHRNCLYQARPFLRTSKVCINISSVVEFQRWWVLKNKLFGQESTFHQGKIFERFLGVMIVCQKLGVILESKVVQKLSLEKKMFLLIDILRQFFFEKIRLIFDIEN